MPALARGKGELPPEETEIFTIEPVNHGKDISCLSGGAIAEIGPVADPGRMRDAGHCPSPAIEQLWAEKSRLDKLFDEGRGGLYFRAREELYPLGRRGSGRFLGNRAGDKLAEVIAAVGGISCALRPSSEETVFLDVCGAPGAWSSHLFRMEAAWGAKMRGYGFSLRDGTNPLSCIWADELTAREDFLALWGSDGTGNICEQANIEKVAADVGRKAMIVLADGGFGVERSSQGEHLENYQEIFCGRILLAEVLLMLDTINVGGCFICKFFDTFSHLSAGLVYIVASLFKDTFIVKPRHSRVVNSERYLVGRKFAGSETDLFHALRNAVFKAHAAWPSSKEGAAWSGNVPLFVVPPSVLKEAAPFLSSFQASVATLCRRQTNALSAVIDRAIELQAEAPTKRQRCRGNNPR